MAIWQYGNMTLQHDYIRMHYIKNSAIAESNGRIFMILLCSELKIRAHIFAFQIRNTSMDHCVYTKLKNVRLAVSNAKTAG